MGADIALPPGNGSYCFRLQGQLYHRAGALQPVVGCALLTWLPGMQNKQPKTGKGKEDVFPRGHTLSRAREPSV